MLFYRNYVVRISWKASMENYLKPLLFIIFMDKIHIWDLDRVHIRLKKGMLDKINDRLSLKFISKKDAYNNLLKRHSIPYITFKNILKPSYNALFFVPLEIYLILTKALDITSNELEKSIVAYKTAGGINYIADPKLPIQINPIFDMILAHNISDGTVINPKKGRLPYFGYRQFNKHYRLLYVRKLEEIFGKIVFKTDYFHSSTRPYCSPVISTLFFKYYNLNKNSFLSRSARIPESIFNNGVEHLLSILIAFIIDEGYIDSTQITIALKNKPLTNDLKKICNILGYKSKLTYRKKKYKDYGYLNILREGMKKFYLDYLLLRKKYPVVDMGWKGDKIKNSFKIHSRVIYKTKGNRKYILKILEKEQLSVNQLANRVGMTRQGIRFHIHNLLKEKKIKLINKENLNWIYGA
jgi:hypothetical protein